jgi:hypothetical protein
MTEANVTAMVPTAPRREVRVVNDPIPVLDTGRFEHMQRIAEVMAWSSLVPKSLTHVKQGDNYVALDPKEIVSNCFLVVNQAVRWGMDPFAVAQSVSVVHGKLCYEGKLISAVLKAKLGVDLEYEITGQGEAMKVVVSAAINGKPVVDSKGRPKIAEGSVAIWKTTGNGSPWYAPGGFERMLRYRGAREWGRIHESSVMLGVYSEDEMLGLNDERRSSHARDVTPQQVERDDGPPMIADETKTDVATEQTKPVEDQGVAGGAPVEEPVYDDAQWLKDLEGSFGGCEDFASLATAQLTYMAPYNGKVTPAIWQKADDLVRHHFERIQEANRNPSDSDETGAD